MKGPTAAREPAPANNRPTIAPAWARPKRSPTIAGKTVVVPVEGSNWGGGAEFVLQAQPFRLR